MAVPSRRQFLATAAVGTVGLAGGIAGPIGAQQADSTVPAEEPTEVDIGFCTDMSAHHVQALALCQRVLGSDTGDSVQNAAAEVLQNQSIEVGMMRAWLADWGESTAAPTQAMGWMDDDRRQLCDLRDMPGLATDADLQDLSLATGPAKGRRWLELMRAHHVGGVAMAERAVEIASSAKVLRIAATQAEVQIYEISQYDHLLADEYA